jgi:hypothetical protein
MDSDSLTTSTVAALTLAGSVVHTSSLLGNGDLEFNSSSGWRQRTALERYTFTPQETFDPLSF